jgi:hypothetical protein
MANIDEIRRRCVLAEWIEELETVKGLIRNDSVEQTGLGPVRKELLAQIDRVIDYANSKKPGFQPFAAVVNAAH